MTGTSPEPPSLGAPSTSPEPPPPGAPRTSPEPPPPGAPSTSPEPPPRGAPTLCLGDAIVELICEHPVESVSDADAFVPHLGGAVANVAVTVARQGAHVAFAGAAGDDVWGRWLRSLLEGKGVETECFELVPGAQTPVAMVAIDREGELRREVYGDRIAAAFGDRLDDAVRASAALYITSGGPELSEVTNRARELALSLERPVVFEPRICVKRWRSRAEASAVANAYVPDALLVCAGAGDAALMTGEDDPERAALALLKAGARMVVITRGSEGAILRGELRLDVDDVPGTAAIREGGADVAGTAAMREGGMREGGADVAGTAAIREGGADVAGTGADSEEERLADRHPERPGAGEVLTGILLARLATSAFYPAAVAASLPAALAESARAYERWGRA